MVSLYFGHVSLHSSALPIPVNQTPKLTDILCLQMLCLPCAFSYPIPVFFLSLHFKNHASQMSPYRITSVITGRCRRELCVVCPASAATSSTSPEMLHRQKHPPNQTSWLLTVFRLLRSPSLPPAHPNDITIIDSADEPEEYTGPQERSHSFVSAYVMHCLILPATLSSYSSLRLQVRSKLMFKLEF